MQRIFHLDFNFLMLTKEEIRHQLASVAAMGYNAILWELEDKVRFETIAPCIHPEALSKEEFAEILAYSRSLGLEPIPLLQTLGHGEYVLGNEVFVPLRELPEWKDCYCVSKPAVRNLLSQLIEEYLDLFGEIKSFHLGGDEAYSFAQCPVCAAKAEKMGKLGLAMEHYAALTEVLIRSGIQPEMWMDIVVQHPDEIKPHLPLLKKFRFWDWHYTRGFGEDGYGNIDLLKEAGLNVIPCSASRRWGDRVFLPSAGHDVNIAGTARNAVKRGCDGYCTTSWAIRCVNFDLQKHLIALGPLAEETETEEIGELLTGSGLLGGDREKIERFLKGTELAATEFPFSAVHELGFCWNRYKCHDLPPEGWLAERMKDKVVGADVRKKLDEAEAIFLSLKDDAPEEMTHWLEAVALEKEHLALVEKALTGEWADAETLRKKVRSAFLRWQSGISAETLSRTLYSPLIDFFSAIKAES